ncbi:extracellular catalytic domain type 1 short-chain-length polyhydroxyalkanoate depolymerase [Simiduia aestuariiviva]|uniref:Poly(Hydroxyalkanoate) depolymerase family esterase n=1 Tax=Simiduia aestuariiviva TaxID=1510459 RepID=A0A839UPG9_9GAMM|nr:PHB depolymerase family esterase [Simiduia aestuariiviva]MBB3167676.1 poly(hydroxyalkanoate) depolymerase family esterase [Simiduia aestuariiviva]
MNNLLRAPSVALITLCTLLLMHLPAHAGSWQSNVAVGGFNRVHIYTPNSLSPIGSGKSLLIVLHGCTQSIDAYKTANLELAAEQYGMVVAVPDAMNKSGYSCWHYWDSTKSRNHKDYKNLISLATSLSSDSSRNIDADQVYIAGLSSGAAFANTTACLAPDVFAGMGISAGPSIGTSSSGAIGTCESANVTSRCNSYAGSFATHFATQIASIAHGDKDTTVDTCYNQQNANGMAGVYGVALQSGSQTLSEGNKTAQQFLWEDGRVSMLWLNNLDHSWSGGTGASGSYISSASINYASYLGEFFKNNNQRVSRNTAPTLSNVTAFANGNSLQVSGRATDLEGSVASVTVAIDDFDSSTPLITLSISTDGADNFSVSANNLADDLYQITVTATDNEGAVTSPATVLTQRVGPEPPATAPVIQSVNATLNGQCATVTGTVYDDNNNLSSVSVSFSNGTQMATLTGNQFSAEQCNLPGGQNTATVTATDSTSLSSQSSVSFTVDAGSTGNYNHHINAGHITWGDGYSACYLAFGTSAFTMREYSAGNNQCEWIADGEPSCNGPTQACSGASIEDADGDGIADSADNCPNAANTDQADNDGDGIGNACDSTPDGDPTPDADGDGVADAVDNCPATPNADQADNDGDGIGNVCDSTPDGEYQCTQTTASNYSHVQAGRATTSGGYAYAKGSGGYMGLYNTYYSSTLAQTAPNYFIIGNCP